MALGTVLSRATGLVRTAALAGALGVSSLADSYNIANTVPTILLVLVTGGTLSAVLIPLLVEPEEPADRVRRAESLGALVLVVTGAATLAAAVLSPLLARLFALGLRGDPEYGDFVGSTSLLLVLFAPQVVAYGLSVHAVAVLNAAGRLALGSFASIATNVVTIGAIAAFVALRPDGGAGTRELVVLGAGTTAGVFAMTAIQVWGARRVLPGMRLLPRLKRDETTNRVLRLGRWTLLYVIANQIGLAVVLTVAAGTPGTASAYQWAFAVMQLPFAVIAVSVLSAVYPRLSRAAAGDLARFEVLVAEGLRLLLVLMLPAAVLLATLAEPVTQLLLGYGAVEAAGVRLIASAVGIFGVALLPFTLFQLMTRAFYARGDTRSPALVNVVVNAVNITGALVALGTYGGPPQRTMVVLVASYATSYLVGCAVLGTMLRRRFPCALAGVGRLTVRLVAPLLAMVATVVAILALLRAAEPVGGGAANALIEVVAAAAASCAVYLLVVFCVARSALPSWPRRGPSPG